MTFYKFQIITMIPNRKEVPANLLWMWIFFTPFHPWHWVYYITRRTWNLSRNKMPYQKRKWLRYTRHMGTKIITIESTTSSHQCLFLDKSIDNLKYNTNHHCSQTPHALFIYMDVWRLCASLEDTRSTIWYPMPFEHIVSTTPISFFNP